MFALVAILSIAALILRAWFAVSGVSDAQEFADVERNLRLSDDPNRLAVLSRGAASDPIAKAYLRG
ncbi:MAG: hypothetical protein WD382_10660 [Halofilum sp. (in: g-proteobacteria)]